MFKSKPIPHFSLSKLVGGSILFLFTTFLFSCSEPSEKSTTDSAIPQTVTYSEQIAPILFKNCTPCHRPGEAGTFDLLTYADAVKTANKIKFVTKTRFMPPWPADPSYSHFLGERVLTDTEIALIAKWVDGGTPLGDTTKLPPVPVFYTGSYFGKPDLVVKAKDAVFLKGNGSDHFLMIKFPYEIPKDTFVRYFEFVPNRRKLVHHVNGHLISYDEKRKFDYQGGEQVMPDALSNFKEVFQRMHLGYTDHRQPDFPELTPNTIYYLPGFTPPVYPDNIGGYVLKKHGVFLMKNIHYGPSDKDTWDSSYINVFYSKTPPVRPLRETQLGTFGISPIEPELVIPPNEIKTFHTQATLDRPIAILSVNPHMHLLGKTFLAYALAPGGDTIPLIRINKWDFRWQYYYTYQHPVKIPAGSTIHVYGTFDNTEKNPFNPYYPPRTVSQGEGVESMQTTEEMFQFIFTYLPYKEGDEKMKLGE